MAGIAARHARDDAAIVSSPDERHRTSSRSAAPGPRRLPQAREQVARELRQRDRAPTTPAVAIRVERGKRA
jgi:hypothetical protein